MNKTIAIFIMLTIMLSSLVVADVSVALKRTNPGIAKVKAAELIYDVVNNDPVHSLEGWILCRTSDDTQITSVMGFSTGSGAQYVSPKFEMGAGPTQKAVYLTIESDREGDFSTSCAFEYVPYKIINETKWYQRQDLKYSEDLTPELIRSLRLDKNVPFVNPAVSGDVYCPIGSLNCNKDNVIIQPIRSENDILKIILIIFVIILAILLIIFIALLRKKFN
jgi:hypothetical protein